MTLTPETLAELRRLEKEATAGLWKRGLKLHPPDIYLYHDDSKLGCLFASRSEADSMFIVVIRNYAPALIDAAERLAEVEKERDRLKTDLRAALATLNQWTGEA
jgi:hypothetical protein